MPRALVVVLGDLARSPRMLRHARSLSAIGCEVDLLGFIGGDLPSDVANDARIHVRCIASFDTLRGSHIAVITILVALLRQIALAMALTRALARHPRPRLVLMQNPPAFPALPILLLFRAKWRARLIIDWHNLTGAMLRLRLRGRLRFVVRGVEWLETMFAGRADNHFAVSQALAGRLSVRSVVVRDGASAAFVARERSTGTVPLIIAPTSWGADEDFSLMADAALLCERAGLHLQFLVTGRGEYRAEYERRFASMPLRNVAIHTEWFAADAYPRAVASADLGLSLHRSSSGADVPMKIPEMLACGVPVCALDCGPALREQLHDGEDGMLFSTATELAALLQSLCGTWPNAPELDRLRASVRARKRPGWDDEWDRSARPVVENAMS